MSKKDESEHHLNRGILKHPAVWIYIPLTIVLIILFILGMKNGWVPNRGISQSQSLNSTVSPSSPN